MYDAKDRLISETITPPSGGLTTTIPSDTAGDAHIKLTATDGTETTYTYDALNCLIQETDTAGGVTETTNYTPMTYAPNLISVMDPTDDATKFSYDAYGDLTSMTDSQRRRGNRDLFRRAGACRTWVSMLPGFAGLAFGACHRVKRSALSVA